MLLYWMQEDLNGLTGYNSCQTISITAITGPLCFYVIYDRAKWIGCYHRFKTTQWQADYSLMLSLLITPLS